MLCHSVKHNEIIRVPSQLNRNIRSTLQTLTLLRYMYISQFTLGNILQNKYATLDSGHSVRGKVVTSNDAVEFMRKEELVKRVKNDFKASHKTQPPFGALSSGLTVSNHTESCQRTQ